MDCKGVEGWGGRDLLLEEGLEALHHHKICIFKFASMECFGWLLEDSIMKTAWCKHPSWDSGAVSGCRMSGPHGPDTSYDPGDGQLAVHKW